MLNNLMTLALVRKNFAYETYSKKTDRLVYEMKTTPLH